MNPNSSKIILDLCGGTGAWGKPYRDAGYAVRLITLPDYDVTKVVFSNDYMAFKKQSGDDMCIKYADVYGILAAPPCTEFSVAKGSRPRDFVGGMVVVRACLEIIWHCRISGGLKFWALENPVGFLRQFLGVPAYQFEQWQFGESRVKRTDIWGYFNIPKPLVKDKPADLVTQMPKGRTNARDWAKTDCPPEYAEYICQFNNHDAKRAALRAITPPGFAEAFYKANK